MHLSEKSCTLLQILHSTTYSMGITGANFYAILNLSLLAYLIPALVAALCVLAAWLFFIKKTVWRLKRVDATPEHLFVTNYWHTVRYPWQDVEQITESRRMGRRLVHFHLKAPGRFGQVFSILPARHYDELMKNLNVREI